MPNLAAIVADMPGPGFVLFLFVLEPLGLLGDVLLNHHLRAKHCLITRAEHVYIIDGPGADGIPYLDALGTLPGLNARDGMGDGLSSKGIRLHLAWRSFIAA